MMEKASSARGARITGSTGSCEMQSTGCDENAPQSRKEGYLNGNDNDDEERETKSRRGHLSSSTEYRVRTT